jgi:predicted histidine transporter YuiF (NhaC family)
MGHGAVERVIWATEGLFRGADDGNIRGGCRFFAFVGVVMVVHTGLATVLASLPRWDGALGQMNLSPIAKKLQALLRG